MLYWLPTTSCRAGRLSGAMYKQSRPVCLLCYRAGVAATASWSGLYDMSAAYYTAAADWGAGGSEAGEWRHKETFRSAALSQTFRHPYSLL